MGCRWPATLFPVTGQRPNPDPDCEELDGGKGIAHCTLGRNGTLRPTLCMPHSAVCPGKRVLAGLDPLEATVNGPENPHTHGFANIASCKLSASA